MEKNRMTVYDKYKEILTRHFDDIDNFMPHINTFQSRIRFTKMIQQYEVFKLAIDRPGHIVELGVFHGESFFHWSRLVEAFNIGGRAGRHQVWRFSIRNIATGVPQDIASGDRPPNVPMEN